MRYPKPPFWLPILVEGRDCVVTIQFSNSGWTLSSKWSSSLRTMPVFPIPARVLCTTTTAALALAAVVGSTMAAGASGELGVPVAIVDPTHSSATRTPTGASSPVPTPTPVYEVNLSAPAQLRWQPVCAAPAFHHFASDLNRYVSIMLQRAAWLLQLADLGATVLWKIYNPEQRDELRGLAGCSGAGLGVLLLYGLENELAESFPNFSKTKQLEAKSHKFSPHQMVRLRAAFEQLANPESPWPGGAPRAGEQAWLDQETRAWRPKLEQLEREAAGTAAAARRGSTRMSDGQARGLLSGGAGRCTSLFVKDSNETMVHGRNLDFFIPPFMRKYWLRVDFYTQEDQGKTAGEKMYRYRGTQPFGFIGFIHGMTYGSTPPTSTLDEDVAAPPNITNPANNAGPWSVSINDRGEGSWSAAFYTVLEMLSGAQQEGVVLRHALQSFPTCPPCAVDFLSNKVRLMAPIYFILSGSSNYGAVIQRDREPGSTKVLSLSTKIKGKNVQDSWFKLQTNFDVDGADVADINGQFFRRTEGIKHLRAAFGVHGERRSRLSAGSVQTEIQQMSPTFNVLTVITATMVPRRGTYDEWVWGEGASDSTDVVGGPRNGSDFPGEMSDSPTEILA